jgi:CubicO group peptidase (beta-lactamase class C family)
MAAEIQGTVAPGFELVRETFQASFRWGGEVGAAVHMIRRGEVVVDLWGGMADPITNRPWQKDTLGLAFSVTKGLAASCFSLLEDRGEVDLNRPVRDVWPELTSVGDLSMRLLLSHRSGLVGLDQDLSLDDLHDRDKVHAALVAQKPRWTPGTDQGYHAISFGLYAAELFRRLADTTIGQFLDVEFAGPLDADIHIGLDPKHNDRVARLIPAHKARLLGNMIPRAMVGQAPEGLVARAVLTKGSDTQLAFSSPSVLGARGIENWRDKRVWPLELPWAGGFATAQGLARHYSGLLSGHVSDAAIRRVSQRVSWSERDRVMHKPMGFSQGFLKEGEAVFSPNPESFGHPGLGGALGWADPVTGVAIGYVMNHLSWRVRSPRALALCHALQRCL